jgi:hypothetical protein
VTCANEGICRHTNTSRCFTCDCKAGFAGAMCEEKVAIVNTSKVFYIEIFLYVLIFVILFKQTYVTFDLVVKVVCAYLLIIMTLYVSVHHLRQDVIAKKQYRQIHVAHRRVSMVVLASVAILLIAFNAYVPSSRLDIDAK